MAFQLFRLQQRFQPSGMRFVQAADPPSPDPGPRHVRRAEEEARMVVGERYRRDYTFNLKDPRLYRWDDDNRSMVYPPYILQAKRPKHRDLKRVAILDGDGVVTDGPIGAFFHNWLWTRRAYYGSTLGRTLFPHLRIKSTRDFLGYHELGAKIMAGMRMKEIELNAREFVEQVVMKRKFNAVPHIDFAELQPSPFIHRGTIELLLELHRRGDLIILASGSSYFAWHSLLDGLPAYAAKFFGLDLPKTPLVDFIIGSRPRFDEQSVALFEAERPLSIGDGKRLLVQKLLEVLAINPDETSVYSDDVEADRPLLTLGAPATRYAVNTPAHQDELVEIFEYQRLRTDGRIADSRSREELDAMRIWRKARVKKHALEKSDRDV